MPTVAVDMDGVVAKYDGWKGVREIGEPIDGAREFLMALKANKCRILVYTARSNVALNGYEVAGTSGDGWLDRYAALRKLIEDYWNKYDLPYDDIFMGQGKPLADAYVDDRAVSCQPIKHPDAFDTALKGVLELISNHLKVEGKI